MNSKSKTKFEKSPETEAMLSAARAGHIDLLMSAISHGADPSHDNSLPIELAARGGHVECVHHLIPLSDPKSDRSLALRMAAENGHVECVKALLPVSDMKADEGNAIIGAAKAGHHDIVALLAESSDEHGRDEAMIFAAGLGKASCCAILKKHCGEATIRCALIEAAKNTHGDCVKTLVGNYDIQTLRGIYGNTAWYAKALNFIEDTVAAMNAKKQLDDLNEKFSITAKKPKKQSTA